MTKLRLRVGKIADLGGITLIALVAILATLFRAADTRDCVGKGGTGARSKR